MDDTLSPEMIEKGRLMFERPFGFLRAAPSIAVLPPMEGMEVTFAGRSNVGKSSLINALTRRKDLARTSNTPGRTQELIFFRAPEVPLTLVDMPGYGFAEAPRAKVAEWTKLIHSYMRGRTNLARVYVLIDSRHGLKPVDDEMFDQLDKTAMSYQVVFTKADQAKKGELPARIERAQEVLKKRPAAFPQIIATSSKTGEGMEELKGAMALLMSERGL
jgi:GTP-binding protein